MAGQATYSARQPIAFEGQFIGYPEDVISRVADSAVQFGYAVSAKDTAQCEVIPAPPASDDDSIIASGFASATSPVSKVAADFNGVIGAADFIDYSQNVIITLNSHTDWDETVGTVRGLSPTGLLQSVAFPIKNGGNVVVNLHTPFRRILEVTIPEQTGTNGTVLVGLGVEYGPILNLLGISIHSPTVVGTGTGYPALQMVAIATKGLIAVTTWDAVVDGQPAFVRHTAADSGFARGTFGGSQDGTYAAPELSPLVIAGKQARWASAASAGQLAWLEIG